MIRTAFRSIVVASLLASAAAAPLYVANAQVPPGNSAPAAQAPFVNTIPDAVDTPYPGTIKLVVDATDTERGIFRVKETIPVAKAGPMALLFPKWLPGAHSPRGEIEIDPRGETSQKGIFAAGDCTTVPYKQIVIAMGVGSTAALSAFDYMIRLPAELSEAA